jgi:hypothetical protein
MAWYEYDTGRNIGSRRLNGLNLSYFNGNEPYGTKKTYFSPVQPVLTDITTTHRFGTVPL